MKLPFMAQVVFSRGQFCDHSTDRQCSACFLESMRGYEDVVGEIWPLMVAYMRDHGVDNIGRMETFTVTISVERPMSVVHAQGVSP